MSNKSLGIKIALGVFFTLMLVDLFTTMKLGHLIPYLEANPLYSKIGIGGICLVNILVIVFIHYLYRFSKQHSTRYVMMNVTVTLIITRIFVIINNIRVLQNPPSLELAKAVTTEMKAQAMYSIIAPQFIPFLIGIAAYYMFMIDHEIKPKWA